MRKEIKGGLAILRCYFLVPRLQWQHKQCPNAWAVRHSLLVGLGTAMVTQLHWHPWDKEPWSRTACGNVQRLETPW